MADQVGTITWISGPVVRARGSRHVGMLELVEVHVGVAAPRRGHMGVPLSVAHLGTRRYRTRRRRRLLCGCNGSAMSSGRTRHGALPTMWSGYATGVGSPPSGAA